METSTLKMIKFLDWVGNELQEVVLIEGEEKTFTYGGRTEEGHDWMDETYCFDGLGVTLTIHRDATDCDGQLSTTSIRYCTLENMDRFEANRWDEEAEEYIPCGTKTPDWTPIESSQRDYSAEAMRY
jgi:hypothetical protein